MASEETSTVNSMVIQFKAQMAVLKLDNKKLSDENHVLRLKMAADGKKLELVRKWITNFDTLYNHLKEIAKDWAADEPIQNENKANASNALAELNVEMRPMAAGGMRVILNRAKLAPRWPTTPTGILQTSMVSRLQKNLQGINASFNFIIIYYYFSISSNSIDFHRFNSQPTMQLTTLHRPRVQLHQLAMMYLMWKLKRNKVCNG